MPRARSAFRSVFKPRAATAEAIIRGTSQRLASITWRGTRPLLAMATIARKPKANQGMGVLTLPTGSPRRTQRPKASTAGAKRATRPSLVTVPTSVAAGAGGCGGPDSLIVKPATCVRRSDGELALRPLLFHFGFHFCASP